MAVVYEVIFSAVHKTTFLAVHIELMRFALSVVYTNPTRLLPLSGEYQAYKTYFLYCKSTPSLQSFPKPLKSWGLPDRLIAHNNWIAWSLSARVERVQGYY